MLSGLKLTPFADNALFFGLTGAGEHAQFRTLFDTAFVVWRKQGVISKAIDSKDYLDTRFVAALADQYQGQKVVEPFRFDPKEAKNPQASAIVNKSLSTRNSAQRMSTGTSAPPPGPASKPPPAAELAVKLPPERSRESLWTLRKALPRRYRVPFAVAAPALVVITWCALTLGAHPIVSEVFLPSPIKVLQATLQMIFEHTLFPAIWASSVRILISFVAAALVALPLG